MERIQMVKESEKFVDGEGVVLFRMHGWVLITSVDPE